MTLDEIMKLNNAVAHYWDEYYLSNYGVIPDNPHAGDPVENRVRHLTSTPGGVGGGGIPEVKCWLKPAVLAAIAA